MKKYFFGLALAAMLTSCLGDDNKLDDYSEWMQKNIDYITKTEADPQFVKVTPVWDQASFTLMKWHKRGPAENKLIPMSNSTIAIKYLTKTIEGDTIDSSYSQTQWGDSLYVCKPNQMIVGFHIATTSMHVGDSVTAVVPYTCAYGIQGSGSVQPYSTLVFEIKLDSIVSLEGLPWRD